MSRYLVKGTFTPRGARVADSWTLDVYCGDVGGDASDHEDWLLAWARESRGGGALLIETWEDGKRVAWINRTIQIDDRPGIQPSGGYPAHDCGAPMVPPDVSGLRGADAAQRHFFCLGCLVNVPASASDRMRAQVAASAERRAASGAA